jgi:hypothetical protein
LLSAVLDWIDLKKLAMDKHSSLIRS